MKALTFDGILAKLDLPPEGVTPSGLGVVIVPPHGIEALAAAKSLRLLAESLTKAGHATLRLDLPGTGDSLGTDLDPGRVDAWLAALATAAEELKRTAGVTGIVLAGLRLGGLLAAAAAARVDGLSGLVLIDPVLRGRLYVRELAMTARAVAEGARLDPDATSTEAGLLVGGLMTTRETLDALKALDLAKLLPATPTLLVHRPAALDAAALAGGSVTTCAVEGLDGIGLSPTMAVTPHAAFAETIRWLQDLPPAPLRVPEEPAPAHFETTDFVEEPITFGPDGRMFGVLCRPVVISGRDVLLIVNAGRNPHVGWARSAVTLARRLAAEGTASFRFDLAGIGDTPDRAGSADDLEDLLYVPEHEGEMAAAVEAMASRGYDRPALLGACSGAHLAFQTAARDPRITGVVIVNIQRFVWRSGETVAEAIASSYAAASSYVAKVWERRAWIRLLTGQRNPLPLIAEFARRGWARLKRFRPSAETREARALVRRLVDRGIPVEVIFSEDDAGLSELARHFGPRGRLLAGAANIRLHYIPNADHDLTPIEARETLFAITARAARDWSAPSPDPGEVSRHSFRNGEAKDETLSQTGTARLAGDPAGPSRMT